MYRETAEELLQFIEKSPTSFHAVHTMEEMLKAAGYSKIAEATRWELRMGGNYYVTRNGSSLIAFSIPERPYDGYHLIASHSDSPTFKIKENPEITVDGHYTKLNIEPYGGMLCAPWFDRPLSVAGRIIVKEGGSYVSKLVKIDRDLVLIPSLAIHMNRQANTGYAYNYQQDLLPLYGDITAKESFFRLIAENANVSRDAVLGHDLLLYNRQKGSIWGASEEFLSCGRLDDLQCAFASLKGFLAGKKESFLAVHCVLDNEEVGSGTKQGADSAFLRDTLLRIDKALGFTGEDFLIHLAKSFLISADNAHAVHPNYTDKADPVNRPYLNKGIVVKYNANQKYCTDAISSAMFKDLCQRIGVPIQTYTNRSDMPGGSTLGNLSNTHVPLNTVDIGLPQLSMHSPYETAGIKDTAYLIKAATEFFR